MSRRMRETRKHGVSVRSSEALRSRRCVALVGGELEQRGVERGHGALEAGGGVGGPDLVEARGIPYRMTLDHSHVIFKMDNPEEQEVQNIRPAVESGELILDPFVDGNVCNEWIQRGLIWHCHARAAAPGGPKNTWAKHEDGSYGRGIQYPFIKPGPGEWHSEWDEAKLEPWKEVIRKLLTYHAANDNSPLMQISTEFIPNLDYGEGCKYSLFEQGIACTEWMRGVLRYKGPCQAKTCQYPDGITHIHFGRQRQRRFGHDLINTDAMGGKICRNHISGYVLDCYHTIFIIFVPALHHQ